MAGGSDGAKLVIQGLDALTGFPGRNLLESIQDEFSRRDSGSQWTFLMIDVDHFKLINDIYGHLIGDQVLAEVARILRKNLRNTDAMIRFGGDEFLGIFRNTSTDLCLNYSERVMEEIRKTALVKNLKPSLSIGLADSSPDDRDLAVMIDRADKALYNAKESGRGRISFAVDARSLRSQGTIRLSHFVGRRSELTSLRQLLDESISEGSRFALIEGDAGVGKSRLANEMVHYAQFRKCLLIKAACFEFGDSEPYGFVLVPLREIIRELSESEMHQLYSTLEPFHPATAELFPSLDFTVSQDMQFFREERLKFRIFEDLSRLLTVISSISPMLFIIDDVQWMTTPDLELLKYLVRSSASARITFVATMRTREKTSDIVRRHLATLNRSVPFLNLKLSNLEQQETYNLIMFALKDPNIPVRALDTIYRQCGGNPFFLEELINSLIQTGSIARSSSGDWSYHVSSDLKLPESLAQLIEARLYPLSTVSRNYLRIAALTAGSFSVEMLCSASGDRAIDVIQGLEEPVQLGLIACESGEGDPVYRFAHDTICSFLHRELSAAMKMVYHKRLAEYLEARCITDSKDDLVIAMAYHYSLSDDRRKSNESALRAAKVFEARQANRDTVRWLEVYFANSDPSEQNREERFQAHIKLGNLYAVLGDWERAMMQLEAGAKLGRSDDDLAMASLKKGHIYQNTSRYADARQCYRLAFQKATLAFGRVEALNALAFLDYLAGDLQQALDNLHHAEQILSDGIDDPTLREKHEASLCITRGVILCAIMPDSDAIAEYEKALAFTMKHGDILGQSTIYNNLSDIYSRMGHYEKALEALKKAEEIDSRLDDALNMAIVCYNTALLYSEINQPLQAREYFQRYADISREINNELGIGYHNLGEGELFEEEGNRNRAEESYRRAMEIFTGLGVESMALAARLSLIHLLVTGDRLGEAETLFREGVDPDRDILEKDLSSDIRYIRALMQLSRRRVLGEDGLDEAERLMRQSLEIGSHMDVSFLMRRYHHLIEILNLKGRPDEAVDTLSEARGVLSERLAHIEKPHIRDAICRKRYIRAILDA